MSVLWFDGRWLDAEAPILTRWDRAAKYGEGLFETILVRKGRPQHLARHLQRLYDGQSALQMETSEIPGAAIFELLKRNAVVDGILRIRVSRGEKGFGYRPAETGKPHLLLETDTLPSSALGPVEAVLSEIRRIPPACLPTAYKMTPCLTSVLALAATDGKQESLMLSTDGHLSSFASGNLFWHVDGMLMTPPLSTGCLAGIVRGLLLERAGATEIEAGLDAIRLADGVVMTNSIRGAVPVSTIAGVGRYAGSAALASSLAPLLTDPQGA